MRVDKEVDQDGFRTPDFEVAGHLWYLRIHSNGSEAHPDFLEISLFLSVGEGHAANGNQDRVTRVEGVEYKLKLINFLRCARSQEFGGTATFDNSHGYGFEEVISLQALRSPAKGYLDSHRQFHILITISVPEAAEPGRPRACLSEPPPASLSGNTLIVLERGRPLRAHSCHLEQASEVLQGALECLQPGVNPAAAAGGASPAYIDLSPSWGARWNGVSVTHSLPLPGVTLHQALLLLHCLYAWARESWAASLSLADLFDLARVADKYACTSVLQLVDTTICKRCSEQGPAAEGAVLTAQTAPEQHRLARTLHLRAYEGQIGFFLGMHADEIDLSTVDPSLAGVLRGASRVRAELLASMVNGQS